MRQRAILLATTMVLLSLYSMGQPDQLKAEKQFQATSVSVPGSIVGSDISERGSCLIVLTDYAGVPWKAIQFRATISSPSGIADIQPGADVADRARWNVHTRVVHGASGSNGSRTDTIKVVVFGNGFTTMPAAALSRLLTLSFGVAGTSASSSVTISIDDVVGALPKGDAAPMHAGPDTIFNLWK
jgi:hypothetical protein